MPLTQSIVEDAAITRFGLLGCAVGHGPRLAPGGPAADWASFGEVGLVSRLGEAIRRLTYPAICSNTIVTLRDTRLPPILSGEGSASTVEEMVASS